MVDELLAPQRFEDAVGEAQREDVLDRLLAEVVIDPEHLMLAECGADLLVERARRFEIVAERLLDDHPRDAAALVFRQPGLAEVLEDGGVGRWGSREVEDAVALGSALRVELLETCTEPRVAVGVVEGRLQVLEGSLVNREGLRGLVTPVAQDALGQVPAELLARLRAPREADHREPRWQETVLREPHQRGDQFAVRQVARGAEDHQDARLRATLGAQFVRERIGHLPGSLAGTLLAPPPRVVPRQCAAGFRTEAGPRSHCFRPGPC